MRVANRRPSEKLGLAKTISILFMFCAATVIASPAQLTTLTSFTGTNGADPQSSLVRGTDGNFYGTTYEGGASGFGTVFKITPSGTLTSLHSFQGPFSDGASPRYCDSKAPTATSTGQLPRAALSALAPSSKLPRAAL